MHIDGRKVAKGLTEQRIIDALEPGYRLVRVNWKKRRSLHAGQALVRSGISFPNLLTGQQAKRIPKADIDPERRKYLQELSLCD